MRRIMVWGGKSRSSLRFFVVGSLLLVAATAFSEDYYRIRMAPEDSTLSIPLVEAALNLPKPAFTSVESFLEWVGKDHPKHVTGTTFLRHSLSSQQGSNLFPRAIAYGTNAQFSPLGILKTLKFVPGLKLALFPWV